MNFSEHFVFFRMTAYNNFVQEKWLKMVIKEGTFEAKSLWEEETDLGFVLLW